MQSLQTHTTSHKSKATPSLNTLPRIVTSHKTFNPKPRSGPFRSIRKSRPVLVFPRRRPKTRFAATQSVAIKEVVVSSPIHLPPRFRLAQTPHPALSTTHVPRPACTTTRTPPPSRPTPRTTRPPCSPFPPGAYPCPFAAVPGLRVAPGGSAMKSRFCGTSWSTTTRKAC